MGPIQLNPNWAEQKEGSHAETWIWFNLMRHIWSNWCCHIVNYCNILQRKMPRVSDDGVTIRRRTLVPGYCCWYWHHLCHHHHNYYQLSPLPAPTQPTPSPTVPLSVVRINNKCLISSPAPHRNIKPSPIITPSALWNNGSESRQRHRATSYTPSLANDFLWENSDSWKARAG